MGRSSGKARLPRIAIWWRDQRRPAPTARPALERPVVRAVRSRFYGPTISIFATEGTPEPLIRNSMYGPGGAKAPLAGATALRVVELVACTVSGKMSWLWLNVCVTEDSRI